MNIKYKKFSL